MKDLWRLLYRDCRHYAFGHFQRRGQTSAWSHCYHNRQSEIHFFVRYTFFGIHAEKCMSCVVFLVNQRSCQVLESFSSHGIAHASITVCQKSPLFWYIYTQPRNPSSPSWAKCPSKCLFFGWTKCSFQLGAKCYPLLLEPFDYSIKSRIQQRCTFPVKPKHSIRSVLLLTQRRSS
jgi:hypothetical protein